MKDLIVRELFWFVISFLIALVGSFMFIELMALSSSKPELNSLENFVAAVFSQLNLNWKDHVEQSQEFMRPTDLISSVGNASPRNVLIINYKLDHQMSQ